MCGCGFYVGSLKWLLVNVICCHLQYVIEIMCMLHVLYMDMMCMYIMGNMYNKYNVKGSSLKH